MDGKAARIEGGAKREREVLTGMKKHKKNFCLEVEPDRVAAIEDNGREDDR